MGEDLRPGQFNQAWRDHRESSKLKALWTVDETELSEVIHEEAPVGPTPDDVEIDLNAADFERVLGEAGIIEVTDESKVNQRLLQPAYAADNALAEDPARLTGLTWDEDEVEAILGGMWAPEETPGIGRIATNESLELPDLDDIEIEPEPVVAEQPAPLEEELIIEAPMVEAAKRPSKSRKILSRFNPFQKEKPLVPERKTHRFRTAVVGAVAVAGAIVVGSLLSSGANEPEVQMADRQVESPAPAETVTITSSESQLIKLGRLLPAAQTQVDVQLQKIAQSPEASSKFDQLCNDIQSGLSNQEILARLDAAVAADHADGLA